ncbi:metal-dependent hydrolase [Halostella sp. PRR32]|uniref:metal-dependent hydrolase n=1 Tax=Halostella sp. PRR32 TaxID=3098147 RepID=UPI002B1E62CF|nr:metal-dependent hydrolase [Halostella sp. PRR32]
MMLPTHALAGMLLALPYALAVPEFAGVALVAGFLGGVVPDLDMYIGHRKTLHYPVYYSVLAVATVPVTVLHPSAEPIAALFFLIGAAVHSVADIFGGGLELRPWEATSNRAVFDHRRGRWIAPRHWVRYDGAPEDLLLSVALAGPLLIALGGVPRLLAIGSLAVAAVYSVVRRALPAVADRLVGLLLDFDSSKRIVALVPARYLARSGEQLSSNTVDE